MSYPILKPNSNWFTPNVNTITRNIITIINIVYSYTPSGNETDSWDTSRCEDLSMMFYSCKTLTTLKVNTWDVSNVKTFDHFIAQRGSNFKNMDVSNWQVTNKCENLNAVFHSYKGNEIDVRGWDTSNVKVFCQMFDGCGKLRKIHGLNELYTSSGRDFTQMLWSVTGLEEMDLSKFDTTHAVDDYLLVKNGTVGDGLSGIFAGGKHANLKKTCFK